MAKPVKKTTNKKRVVLKTAYAFILIAALVFGTFFFVRYLQVNAKYKDAVMTQDERNQAYLAKIGKLMDLPNNEQPIIYSVKDKTKLGNAAVTKKFFESANDGDIVVAYKNANLSIIYRPSSNKIIKTDNYNNFLAAVSPVSVAIIAPKDQQDATAQQLSDKVLNVDIVAKQEPKVTETQSYVADATGTNAQAAKSLADKLSLPVGQLPDGETKPSGATLIVVIAPAQSQQSP